MMYRWMAGCGQLPCKLGAVKSKFHERRCAGHGRRSLGAAAPTDRLTEGSPMQLRAAPHGPLAGTIRLPGDKSISHRSLMSAALARGGSEWAEGAETIETSFPGLGLRGRIGLAGRA
jgi:hypothetical protein